MRDRAYDDTMTEVAAGVGREVPSQRDVIDALPRAVVVTDADGTILLWNAASEALYGWREDEVLGRSVVDVLAPPDELAANRDELEQVRAGRVSTGDRTVRRRDGGSVRINTITRPLLDRSGSVTAIVGSAADVTALRVAEQDARDLSDHFGLALSAGGLGTWRWDMASGATVWDERLEQLFGLAPGTFDGTYESYVALLHPDDRAAVLDRVQRAVAERGTYRVEHRVVWPDGSVHWITGAGGVAVDEDGEVTGTIGCCMDVTERVVQQRESERLRDAALETADSERVLRERLEFLGTVHDALASAPDRPELMANVTTAAVPRLGDWCTIHLLPDEPGGDPQVAVAHVDPAMVSYARDLQQRFPFRADAPTGVAHVIRTGELEFHPDISEQVLDDLDTTDEARDVVRQLALRSAITVPIAKAGRVFGAMQFVMSSSSRRYTSDDVSLATIVAGRIASALEVRRLNDQQRLVADTLQHSLLPSSPPTVPGFDIAARYWATGEGFTVGGDFYDVFPLDDGSWAVVIGDVCGTGPAAAALTGLARHTIRDSAWHGDDPAAVLRSLNRAIFRADTDSFCTAVYGRLTSTQDAAELEIVCGGHPLPILVGPDGVRALGGPGTLLGVFAETRLGGETVALRGGDIVVFFTDGVTDVPPPHALTDDEFRSLVARAAVGATGVEQIADRIHDQLERIIAFEHRSDDIALLVLARHR